MVYIYGLYSDDINNIRYVGKTINPTKRLKQHIKDTQRGRKTHKHFWINSELQNGNKINMIILEECNDNWEDREKYWISYYDNLTNHTIGGEGGSGFLYDISYDDAKKIVQSLGIKSRRYFTNYIKNTPLIDIPYSPDIHFKNKGSWVSWGDFFGTGRKQDNLLSLDYISYEDAKLWIKNNYIINTTEDWKKLAKENKIPYKIPNRPERYYNKKDRGWISWCDFLGNGRISNKEKNQTYISYEESKTIINKLGIKSISEWRKKFNTDILQYHVPSHPHKVYKEWINWGEFLGTGRKQDNLLSLDYVSYEDAKLWVKNNIIKTPKDWKILIKENKIPNIIPNHPEVYYKKKR